MSIGIITLAVIRMTAIKIGLRRQPALHPGRRCDSKTARRSIAGNLVPQHGGAITTE
jgi:hypothetical protein